MIIIRREKIESSDITIIGESTEKTFIETCKTFIGIDKIVNIINDSYEVFSNTSHKDGIYFCVPNKNTIYHVEIKNDVGYIYSTYNYNLLNIFNLISQSTNLIKISAPDPIQDPIQDPIPDSASVSVPMSVASSLPIPVSASVFLSSNSTRYFDKTMDFYINSLIDLLNKNGYKSILSILNHEQIVKFIFENEQMATYVIDRTKNKHELVPNVCKYSSSKIIKYLINLGIDLEHRFGFNYRIIHYICEYSPPETIKYIIDKGVDLECKNNSEWKPIHYICRYSTPEMIKYIIDKGVDLECENDMKMKPIHYICSYSTPEMIKYIIDKGVDLECISPPLNWKPIHYICKFSTPEMIKYIIDKGVDLECEDICKMRPIHYICERSTPEMIKYIIDKGVDLECQNNSKWKPIHYICRFSTPEMIKYIINKGVDIECQTQLKWRPIHFIYRYSSIDMREFIKDKCDHTAIVSGYVKTDGTCAYGNFDIYGIMALMEEDGIKPNN